MPHLGFHECMRGSPHLFDQEGLSKSSTCRAVGDTGVALPSVVVRRASRTPGAPARRSCVSARILRSAPNDSPSLVRELAIRARKAARQPEKNSLRRNRIVQRSCYRHGAFLRSLLAHSRHAGQNILGRERLAALHLKGYGSFFCLRALGRIAAVKRPPANSALPPGDIAQRHNLLHPCASWVRRSLCQESHGAL